MSRYTPSAGRRIRKSSRSRRRRSPTSPSTAPANRGPCRAARLLLDAQALALVAALGIVAAVVGGMGGFGTGIILTAALAPFIGVKAVIPVLAVAGAIINAGRFWFYPHSVQRQTLAVVLARALPLPLLGTWVHNSPDAGATR